MGCTVQTVDMIKITTTMIVIMMMIVRVGVSIVDDRFGVSIPMAIFAPSDKNGDFFLC